MKLNILHLLLLLCAGGFVFAAAAPQAGAVLNQGDLIWDAENWQGQVHLEAKYKKRYMELLKKLNEAEGMSDELGWQRDRTLRFEGSRHIEVNLKLVKFVERERDLSGCVELPDFEDVHELYKECNEKYQYNMTSRAIESAGRFL